MKAVLVILVAANLVAFGQAPDVIWSRTFEDDVPLYKMRVEPTSDSGFVVATSSIIDTNGNELVWGVVRKVDAWGSTQWRTAYGAVQSDLLLIGVNQLSDGSFAATGQYLGRLWLSLTSAAGDILWTRIYADGAGAEGYDVAEAPDGGFLVFANAVNSGYSWDVLIMKMALDGEFESSRFAGGLGNQLAHGMTPLSTGGFLLVGQSDSRPYSLCLDANLDTVWTWVYSSESFPWGQLWQGEETDHGTYVVAGYMQNHRDVQKFFIAELDQGGGTVWMKLVGAPLVANSYSMAPGSSGGYVLAGGTYSLGNGGDVYLVKVDSVGEFVWSCTYGGPELDFASCIRATTQGGFIVGGASRSYAPPYPWDPNLGNAYLLRLSQDGDCFNTLLMPNGQEIIKQYVADTVRWCGEGFQGGVIIELNRAYPNGPWEFLLSDSANDGWKAVTLGGSISIHARIRISSTEGDLHDLSDDDFTIAPSDGYLALVRPDNANEPVLEWSTGILQCPLSRIMVFHFKNFGPESIVVHSPEPLNSGPFGCTNDYPSLSYLAPGQMSACSLVLTFDPVSDGLYRDTLMIQSDAVNQIDEFVRIPLAGTQLSTPATPVVVIAASGEDAVLNWQPVTQSVGGCPVDVTRYLVFYSSADDGTYEYHGWTAGTTYMHAGAITYASGMFYRVEAIAGNVRVDGLARGMTREEVHAALRR